MSESQIEAQETEVADDELATLPAERLAAMLRDKRKAEATVRGKLRDAEAQRDTLAASVLGFQQEALRAAAAKSGMVATALPDLGTHVPLESVLGEDGLLDPVKAETALAGLKTSRPHFFPAAASASGASFAGGSGERYGAGEASWGDVL